MRAKASPPMPIDIGSSTPRTAAVATAASTALPPRRSTSTPASDARGWLQTTMPFLPITVDRGFMSPLRIRKWRDRRAAALGFLVQLVDELLALQAIDDRVVGEGILGHLFAHELQNRRGRFG